MTAVDDCAEQVGVQDDQIARIGDDPFLQIDLSSRDRDDIDVAQFPIDVRRVLARILRDVGRRKMSRELFGQLALSRRFGAGQADDLPTRVARLVLADLAVRPGMAPARAARPALSCGPLVTGAPYQAASVTPWW